MKRETCRKDGAHQSGKARPNYSRRRRSAGARRRRSDARTLGRPPSGTRAASACGERELFLGAAPHLDGLSRPPTGGRRELIAGHSAHVFHGLDRRVLYDLGDILDDFGSTRSCGTPRSLLLFLVDLAGNRLEAIPLKLESVHRRLADGNDAAWRGAASGKRARRSGRRWPKRNGRLVASWR